jgi:predicted ATPase
LRQNLTTIKIMRQQLRKIHIKGYKSLKDVEIELSNLNVLIGANGSGKSNFIGVFRFIRHLVNERLQFYVGQKGGADKLLYYSSKETNALEISLDITDKQYSFKLVPRQGDRLMFEYEYCVNGETPPNRKNINTTFTESDLAAYSREKNYGVGQSVFSVLKEWQVYHFHDTSDSAKVKKTNNRRDTDYLFEDASNLAAFLWSMQEHHPKHYTRIVKTIQLVIPFFKDFYFRAIGEKKDKVLLEWQDKYSEIPFSADDLSDGSLRFMCLATLLLQPELPSLILLDEPELGLHPAAISSLTGLLRKASAMTQVIVSTQSVSLVNELEAEDIIVVGRKGGESTFSRLDTEKLAYWLEEYSLGDIWEKNIIGGRPSW